MERFRAGVLMSAGSWEQNRQFLSIDPYGDWALGDGRDFLTSFLFEPTYENFPLVVVASEDKDGNLGELKFDLFDASSASFIRSDDPEFLNLLENRSEGDTVDRAVNIKPSPIPESFVFPIPIKTDGIVRDFQPNLEKPYAIPSSLNQKDANPVIIGVIDDAANVTLPRFSSDEHGSRVDYLWVQEAKSSGDPFDQFFGREYERHEIELAASAENPILELGLNEISHTEHLNGLKMSSHGSAVLDIAAGYKSDEQPQNQRIVSVQLPTASNWDSSGSSVGWLAAIGVTYILKRALRIAKALQNCGHISAPVPVVINLSYGIAGGAHDGTGVFERLIDRELDRFQNGENSKFLGPISIVFAAGNDFIKRRHASVERGRTSKTSELDLAWRISPGDRSSSFIELWFDVPEQANALISQSSEPLTVDLLLQPPVGERFVKKLHFSEGDLNAYSLKVNEDIVATVYWEKRPKPDLRNKPQKARILIAVAPTETSSLSKKRKAAPAGVWKIEVKANSSRIDSWIQREEGSFNDPVRGAKTVLEDREYQRFTYTGDQNEIDTGATPIQRLGTLNGAATGKYTLVVGAYRNADGKALQESSAANSRIFDTIFDRNKDNITEKGFFAAPADTSRILRGIQTATNGAGLAIAALTGTSSAAPQVVRLIAQYHTSNPGKTADDVKKFLDDRAVDDEQKRQTQHAWSPPLPGSPEYGRPEQQPPIDKFRAGSGRVFSTDDLRERIERRRHS